MPPRRRKAAAATESTHSVSDVPSVVTSAIAGSTPRDPQDRLEQPPPPTPDEQSADTSKTGKRHQHSRRHRMSSFLKRQPVFILGALFGIVIAWYFASTQQLVSLDSLGDINLDAISEFMEDMRGRLPIGILKDVSDISNEEQSKPKTEAFVVGKQMYNEGLRAKFPVVMVPGVISTGLESWSVIDTKECNCESYFRKRLWGSWNMLRAMLLDKNCWLKHIMLDPETGLDPPGYKLRAAEGLDAADFFITGYWIWNKILENLAVISYDTNMMYSAAYDWRLSYMDLERRDGYFSKLKLIVEDNKRRYGEKTVFVSHSMGSQVLFFFLKWVEASGPRFGNGGKSWVNDHIEAFVDIAGSSLGTPKAIVALLSGEMRDTVQLNAIAVYGLEKFFSRAERALMLRSFPGIASMLPKGGEDVWGSLTMAPDDIESKNKTEDSVSFGNFIQFRETLSALSANNLTIPASIEYLFSQSPPWFTDRVMESYSFGLAKTRAQVEANEDIPQKWANPLEVALPFAPDLKIYCLYGVGKATERAYIYQEEVDKQVVKLNVSIARASMADPVVMGEGDGTVSLMTHALCHRWRDENSKLNPAGSRVTIVEMLHEPERFDVRGGAKTADHVDILGRTELNEMVLKIAAGKGDTIEDRMVSRLAEYAAKIDLGEN
ncbi:Lecithin:cholesterol acyltransferase-domain-containing protein [Limtongia smithiae]|uniref:Lecithin:cholesterol acyltransferase-domain-containing protein n=1 Tax=Limtongia smithiae TaxID=1125753 RepID=UPI0034CFDB40